MKRISKILILFYVICLFCDIANAQNDAFFYENYEQRIENNHIGFNFGHFSTDETGLNFGDVNTGENGFNFGDYNTSDDGLKFSGFEMEAENATIGSGVLLLSGLAVLRLRKQNKK